MSVGNQHTWTVIAWKEGVPTGNLTRMTASNARSVARQLDIVYPEYRHEAMKLEEAKDRLAKEEKAK